MLITTTTRIIKVSFRCVFLCFCVYVYIYVRLRLNMRWVKRCVCDYITFCFEWITFFFVCVSFCLFSKTLSRADRNARDVLFCCKGRERTTTKAKPPGLPPKKCNNKRRGAAKFFFFFLMMCEGAERAREVVCFCRFLFYPFLVTRHFWKEAQAAISSSGGKDTLFSLVLLARVLLNLDTHTHTH